MNSRTKPESIFGLPTTPAKASQVTYGVMAAGFFLCPMVFITYRKFVEPFSSLNTREMFFIFTGLYMVSFFAVTAFARTATGRLQLRLDKSLPLDSSVIAPAAANSGSSDVVALGRKYWFWQLVSSYFSGVAFSWLLCVFVLFIF
jgi:hypothetical protein